MEHVSIPKPPHPTYLDLGAEQHALRKEIRAYAPRHKGISILLVPTSATPRGIQS